MQHYISLITRFIRKHRALSVGISLVLVLGLIFLRGGEKKAETETTKDRVVSVASVGDLSAHTTPLPLLGTVVSSDEAIVRADASGMITVYRKSGDFVAPGVVIAEFENSTERASVLSAQGVVASAKAALVSAKAGSSIAEINSNTSGTNLENTKTSAINTIGSVYVLLDDAVRTKTDPMFSNPQLRDAKFTVSISDAKLLITLEDEHIRVEQMLAARALRNKTLSTDDDLLAELNTIEDEANLVKQYLDHLSLALSLAIPDQNVSRPTVDGYKSVASLARSSVSGAFSVITGARSALNGSISGSQVAGESLAQSTNGSVAAAQAGLLSAEGALQAAESRLEKTIVRSPIAGTINSLSVSTGDHVSPYTEVAVVSNNGALEVLGYATAEDARAIRVGGVVRINGTDAEGVVTRIASALDPKTKKIEVRVGITKGAGKLVNGQSARMEVLRATVAQSVAPSTLQIPLSALKITPYGPVVFTVSASSTLVAHPVTEGSLSGADVVIMKGVTPDMEIVVDARGLKDGQEVELTR